MTFQRVAAVARQVLALLGVIFGVLTQTVSVLHLPPAVSSVLVVAGGVILAIEHYVSDPSTGTTGLAAGPGIPVPVVTPSTLPLSAAPGPGGGPQAAPMATKPHAAP